MMLAYYLDCKGTPIAATTGAKLLANVRLKIDEQRSQAPTVLGGRPVRQPRGIDSELRPRVPCHLTAIEKLV